MLVPNWYEVLKVSPDASETDIRKAYRRLALIYHPDKSSDPANLDETTKQFHLLNDAINVLLHRDLRLEYDRQLNLKQHRPIKASKDHDTQRKRDDLLRQEGLSKDKRAAPKQTMNYAMMQQESSTLKKELALKRIQQKIEKDGRSAKIELRPGDELRLPHPSDPKVEKILRVGNSALVIFRNPEFAREFIDLNLDMKVRLCASWISDWDIKEYLEYTSKRIQRRTQ